MGIWGKLRRSTPLAFLLITLGIVATYGPTLSGEFLLDDHVLIRNNPFIKQSQSLAVYLSQEDGILDRNNWDGEFHTGYYRPLINFTYFIDYTLWGMNPAGFHLSNIVFHILACFALYCVLACFCERRLAAIGLSLLFALHPVNTEAVAWIASRNNILATFFSLAAFYCYCIPAPKRRILLRVCALVFFTLSMFCKEFGVMLLPVFFLYNRFSRERKPFSVHELIGYLPFLLALTGYLWARTVVTGSLTGTEAGFTLWWRIAFAPYLVARNLSLLFFPFGLHNFLVVYPQSLLSQELIFGILVIVLMGILLWICRREKIFIFGILSFLVALFPVLNIVPTASATLIAMRWLYFPSVFLFMAICPIVDRHGGRKTTAVILCAVLFSGGVTYRLNRDLWHDEPSFFQNEVLRYHNHLYAGGLAELYAQNGEFGLAEKYFKIGITDFPTMIENQINYSALLIETERSAEALEMIDKALTLAMSRTNRGGLYSNQGMALARLGRLDEATSALENAMALAPEKPDIINNLGTIYGMAGEYARAKDILLKGIAIDPDSLGLKRNLALTYLKTGEYRAAAAILESIPVNRRRRDPAIAALLEKATAKAR